MKINNIIILIPHYFPGNKAGGPTTSILNMVNSLSSSYNFKIITYDRDYNSESEYDSVRINDWNFINNSHVYYLKKSFFSFLSLLRIIRKEKDCILYLNSFFHPLFSIVPVFYFFIRLIKPKKIILAPRGELFEEALAFNKFKKYIYIKLSILFNFYNDVSFHATNLTEKIFIQNKIRINPTNILVAMMIPDMSEITNNNFIDIESKTTRTNCLKLIWLARISKDKNLLYVLDILKMIEFPVFFDIYGPIEDKSLWLKFNKQKSQLSNCVTVSYKGEVKREEVKNVLSQYDLFILPTFAENFGHSISESLSVGTPVLISDNTPWRNLIELEVGWDFDLEDKIKFRDAISQVNKWSWEQRLVKRNHIKSQFIKMINIDKVLLDNINLFK